MTKEKHLPLNKWIAFGLNPTASSIPFSDKNERGYLSIPIRPHTDTKHILPVHFSISSQKAERIGRSVLVALGGTSNIETYREIPNSRRIRLTLINPSLVDSAMLEEADVRLFIRIGKRIVHIIP